MRNVWKSPRDERQRKWRLDWQRNMMSPPRVTSPAALLTSCSRSPGGGCQPFTNLGEPPTPWLMVTHTVPSRGPDMCQNVTRVSRSNLRQPPRRTCTWGGLSSWPLQLGNPQAPWYPRSPFLVPTLGSEAIRSPHCPPNLPLPLLGSPCLPLQLTWGSLGSREPRASLLPSDPAWPRLKVGSGDVRWCLY